MSERARTKQRTVSTPATLDELTMEPLYTTSEIMMVTGLGRGTITNRAVKYGFLRNGKGYTVEQIMTMLTEPKRHPRNSQKMANELREKLTREIVRRNLPMVFLEDAEGNWKLYDIGEEGRLE